MAKSDRLGSIQLEVEDLKKSRSTVKITADKRAFDQITRRLRPYKSLPEKFRPVLGDVAEYVRREMIPRTFQREGPGWAPLSKRTQREREMQGYNPSHPILRRTGDLMRELTEKSHPKHIELIKVGRHARIEIGGSSEKFIQNQMGVREQRLPARPMVPGTGNIRITDRDRKRIAEIIRRSLKKELKKK